MTAVLALDVNGVLVGFDLLPGGVEALPYGQWGTALDVLIALNRLQVSVEIVWLTTWFDFAAQHFVSNIGPATMLAWCDDHLS